jgi:hypothetical protein
VHATTPRLPASEAYKLQPLRFARRQPPPPEHAGAAPPAAATVHHRHTAGHRLIGPATA